MPIARRERLKESAPACGDAFEHLKRGLDRTGARIRKLGPALFRIGPDDRQIFRDGKLGANVPIHLGVGKMMDYLAYGPAAGAIGRIELAVGKSGDRRSQFRGPFRELREK